MSIVRETGFRVGIGTSTSVSFTLRNVSQALCTLNTSSDYTVYTLVL